jgi:hypothetical protein
MKDLFSSVHFDRMPLRHISLPDVGINIDYLYMESFSSYNVYYFKLYYKDNAPVPCIATGDVNTNYKLPIHYLLSVIFRYKTTLPAVRAMLMEFLGNGGRNSFSGFAVCCLLLRNYYVLRDLISDDDAETVYNMVTRKHLYTWYVNDDEMPAEYVTHLRVEYLPKDITLRAVPIPHEEPQPYNIRGYYA